MKINWNQLGENIKEYRKEAGLTQIDISEILDVSQQAYQQWETGRNITVETLISIAAAIGMNDYRDLLRGVELEYGS